MRPLLALLALASCDRPPLPAEWQTDGAVDTDQLADAVPAVVPRCQDLIRACSPGPRACYEESGGRWSMTYPCGAVVCAGECRS